MIEAFEDCPDFKLAYSRAMGKAGGKKHVGLKSKWKNRKKIKTCEVPKAEETEE